VRALVPGEGIIRNHRHDEPLFVLNGENADYGTLLTAVRNQRRAISALGVGPAPSGNRVAPRSSSTN
jgi:hypothetical protein